MQRFLFVLFVVFGLTGSSHVMADGPRILVMGDSLLASNGISGRSVPRLMSQALGEPVTSRARMGAWMIYRLPISGAAGMSIPKQFRSGDPDRDWIVVNGGGNDLWLGCGCNKCEDRLNRLASEDGKSGAVLALLADLRRSGANVLYVGYLRSPGFETPIEHCKDEGEALEARVARFARRYRGIHFLSLADLVPTGDTSFHAADLVHPSVKGSQAIADRIAGFIRRY